MYENDYIKRYSLSGSNPVTKSGHGLTATDPAGVAFQHIQPSKTRGQYELVESESNPSFPSHLILCKRDERDTGLEK